MGLDKNKLDFFVLFLHLNLLFCLRVVLVPFTITVINLNFIFISENLYFNLNFMLAVK